MSVPRRRLLTLGNGDMVPRLRGGEAQGHLSTWLWIVPLESHCYAARIGFANPYRHTMVIESVTVWPSDSYNPVPNSNGPGTSIGVPTGGASFTQVTFDHVNESACEAGAHPVISNGSAKKLALVGNPKNETDAGAPFNIVWSDLVPVATIPRADGGEQPLLFVYCAIAPGALIVSGITNPYRFCTPAVNRGRDHVCLQSAHGDWTANPGDTSTWGGLVEHDPNPLGAGSQMGFHPALCIQYLSEAPGIQIATNGDSHSVGSTDDSFSSPVQRAAYDLSSLDRPVCVANLAWGAQRSDVWHEVFMKNVASIVPSIAVLQWASRNDGTTIEIMNRLLAKQLVAANYVEREFGAEALFQGPMPLKHVDPRYGGASWELAAWRNAREQLLRYGRNGGACFDPAAVLGTTEAWWVYEDGLSPDDVHPNGAAAELCVPMASKSLSQLIES